MLQNDNSCGLKSWIRKLTNVKADTLAVSAVQIVFFSFQIKSNRIVELLFEISNPIE